MSMAVSIRRKALGDFEACADAELGLGLGLHFVDGDAVGQFEQRHAARAFLVDAEHAKPRPVSGKVHSFRSLDCPSLETCSMVTMTRFTPATRSMAPPMPFTILPGIIQLARSPFSATSMAPRIERSIWPPRIMAKLSADEKKLVVGSSVTVCFPALMRSGSSSPS